MKENKLADISMDFSVQIINLVKDLKAKHELVILNIPIKKAPKPGLRQISLIQCQQSDFWYAFTRSFKKTHPCHARVGIFMGGVS
ncbi:MAG: hypothetical protein ACOYJY_01080 [Acutalibacteraceae bacterium]|jgi:hypothetical protein